MNSIIKILWNSPYFLLVFSALFWAGNAVTGRFLADSVPPFTISLMRLAVSTIFIVPFIYPILKKEWNIAKKQFKLLILLATTGVIGFNLLCYWALHYTSAINVALLNSTSPLFMVILAYFFIREKINTTLFLSIMISIIGILWVMTQGSIEKLFALQFNIGDLIMLLAVLLWSIYSIYIKKAAGVLSPLSVFGYSLVLGLLLLIPASTIELFFVPLGHIGIPEITGFVYLGIFPSICSFLMWNRAILLIGPSRSSVFLNLIPVFGAILAYFILGEIMTSAHYLGGLLVFAGIFLARKKAQISSAAPRFTHKQTQ